MTNFDFLLSTPKFDTFAPVAVSAEKILHIDASDCVLNCRRAMEFAVKWMYSVDKALALPYQDTLVSLLNTEDFRDIVGTDIWRRMDFIRRTGNNAAHTGKKITKEQALEAFKTHDRIRVVRIADGFLGNASMFKYARDLGNPRGDMYEIGLWEESIVEYGDQIMFAIYIPQEAVTIPETLDGVRAALHMQDTMEEATAKTNEYLGMAKWK